MTTTATVLEIVDRMPDLVRGVVADRSTDDLAWRPAPDANSVAWLVWHLARVEDDHIAGAAAALGRDDHADQAWTSEGWFERFALPFPAEAHGYGMSSDEVGRVRASAELLTGYYDAVHARTVAFLAALDEDDWERVVDEDWDPPVTLRARVVSVIGDINQHIGQAAYVTGLPRG